MKVSGQLEESSLELLATDPTNLPEGRIWENTATNDFKAVLNGIVRKILTEVSVLVTANYADSSVTTAKIADDNVTTAKIADGSITQAKRASLGQQVSSLGSGSFSTTSATPVDVTNLSVTITTTGRPVWVGLIHDDSSGSSSFVSATNNSSSTSGVAFTIVRGSTNISVIDIGGQSLGSTTNMVKVPCGSINTIDYGAVAGTYTYKLQANVGFGTADVRNCKLIAYEL